MRFCINTTGDASLGVLNYRGRLILPVLGEGFGHLVKLPSPAHYRSNSSSESSFGGMLDGDVE